MECHILITLHAGHYSESVVFPGVHEFLASSPPNLCKQLGVLSLKLLFGAEA
jgi:hypothetical protein